MAEIKDKIVTVESLNALHAHNQNSYMTKTNPVGDGVFTMAGDGNFSGSVNAVELVIGGAAINYDETEGALKISFLTEEAEVSE